jgi:hypothetical protein
MAGTKRTPIRRPPTGGKITAEAVRLYDVMRRVRCTCPGGECAGCRRWWKLHDELHTELRLQCWDWPAILSPHSNWVKAEAQERWRQLDAASREARRARRKAKRTMPTQPQPITPS